jgi:hypothetical protein
MRFVEDTRLGCGDPRGASQVVRILYSEIHLAEIRIFSHSWRSLRLARGKVGIGERTDPVWFGAE